MAFFTVLSFVQKFEGLISELSFCISAFLWKNEILNSCWIPGFVIVFMLMKWCIFLDFRLTHPITPPYSGGLLILSIAGK